MANLRAAQRYAKALLDLSQENKNSHAIATDVNNVAATLKASRELRSILRSPVVKPSVKRKSLKAIFKDVDKSVSSLFDILIDNGRIAILDKVAHSFMQQYNRVNNIKVAKVTTAEALTPEMEEKLLSKVKDLTGSKVTMEKRVDPEILGGFVLRIDDTQYDASVAGKLYKLRKQFTENAEIKL